MVDALAAAPAGTGPDSDPCADGFAQGDVLTTVEARASGSEPAEVVLRYAGCRDHGSDDGTA